MFRPKRENFTSRSCIKLGHHDRDFCCSHKFGLDCPEGWGDCPRDCGGSAKCTCPPPGTPTPRPGRHPLGRKCNPAATDGTQLCPAPPGYPVGYPEMTCPNSGECSDLVYPPIENFTSTTCTQLGHKNRNFCCSRKFGLDCPAGWGDCPTDCGGDKCTCPPPATPVVVPCTAADCNNRGTASGVQPSCACVCQSGWTGNNCSVPSGPDLPCTPGDEGSCGNGIVCPESANCKDGAPPLLTGREGFRW